MKRKLWLEVELIFVKIRYVCRFYSVLRLSKQDMILDRFLKERSLRFLDEMTVIDGKKNDGIFELIHSFFKEF